MKQRIFNLIILDESGSMFSIENQAITGVNETVQTIRKAQSDNPEQEHFVSLVAFNSAEVKTIYDRIEANRVEELTSAQYTPACATPLYDAMGNALTALRGCVADNDVVLVTIITDGYENSSSEYTANSIKALVDSLKEKGWIFTYIGANQDVEKVALNLSITNTLAFSADAVGTSAMFDRDMRSRSRFFSRLADKVSLRDLADEYFDED